MGSHPINLTCRFLLELAALFAVGFWGWNQTDNWIRYMLALGIPVIVGAIWGIFAVPDDPSRSGSAPAAIRGKPRLLLELAVFAFAAWALGDSGLTRASWIFGFLVIFHYVLSYDRIKWLMQN